MANTDNDDWGISSGFDEDDTDEMLKQNEGTHYRGDDTIDGDAAAQAIRAVDDAISKERDEQIRAANEDFEQRKAAGRLSEDEQHQETEELKHYKKNLWEYVRIGVIYAYLAVTWGIVGVYAVRFVKAVKTLDIGYFMPNVWLTVWFLVGITVWLYSTMIKHWTYDIRIKSFFITLLALLSVELASTFFYLPYKIILPFLAKPEPNKWVTKDDWVFLYRIIVTVPSIVLTIGSTTALAALVFEKLTFKEIKKIRIENYLDLRKNKKWLYDTRKVVCKSSNAHYQTVREMDRYLHSMIIGATGGGKTSSIILPMIDEDLIQRAKNGDALRKEVMQMLRKKQAYMSGPVSDGDYWIKNIVAVEGYEKKLQMLKEKYRPCGMTIMAPDPSLTDDAYLLGIAKGGKVNRIDPIPADYRTGKKKSGYIGFNPLYISPDIPEWAHTKEIVKKATLFADVLQSIDDMRGHGDPYFTNLNRCMTVSFIICLEVAYPRLHNGKQPTPAVLRDCINDFEEIRPYYNELKKCDTKNQYSFVTQFIKLDIFGPNQEKMLDQVRGLRNLIDLLLATPSFADILCVDEEHTLDMDKMLSEGQITVIDYAYEEGVSDSTGFGLFIMLSFIDAVLRRPGNEKTRIPHFFYLDEASILVTPRLEQAVSLFRKFRCALTFATQSLVQFERTEQTRTLKGVMISGCSQHYLFSRCGIEEMRTYCELAGLDWTVTEMKAVTETALSTDNPTYSYQDREQLTKENLIEGYEMRNLPFQELTVFSVRNGNLIMPYFGKVDFLKKTRYNKRKRYEVDWEDAYKKYSYTNFAPDSETMKAIESAMPEKMEEAVASTAAVISVFEENPVDKTIKVAPSENSVKAAPDKEVSKNVSDKEEDADIPEASGNNISKNDDSVPSANDFTGYRI